MTTEMKLDLIASYQKKIRLAALNIELGIYVDASYVEGQAQALAAVRAVL